mmetsp:Transcript_97662/g.298414  ORF Transcript_97662/g.298414 Transcript_97662/m.298414 type:complete len:256 (+) Transcript_97662:381-1148(+)
MHGHARVGQLVSTFGCWCACRRLGLGLLRGFSNEASRWTGWSRGLARRPPARGRPGDRGVDLCFLGQPARWDLQFVRPAPSAGVGCLSRVGCQATRHGDKRGFPDMRLPPTQVVRRRCGRVRDEQVHLDDASLVRAGNGLLPPRGGRHVLRSFPPRLVHRRDRRVELFRCAAAPQGPFFANHRPALRRLGWHRCSALPGVARSRQGHDPVRNCRRRGFQHSSSVGDLRHARPPEQVGRWPGASVAHRPGRVSRKK